MKIDKTEASEKGKAKEVDTPFQRFRRLVSTVVSAPKGKTNNSEQKHMKQNR